MTHIQPTQSTRSARDAPVRKAEAASFTRDGGWTTRRERTPRVPIAIHATPDNTQSHAQPVKLLSEDARTVVQPASCVSLHCNQSRPEGSMTASIDRGWRTPPHTGTTIFRFTPSRRAPPHAAAGTGPVVRTKNVPGGWQGRAESPTIRTDGRSLVRLAAFHQIVQGNGDALTTRQRQQHQHQPGQQDRRPAQQVIRRNDQQHGDDDHP